MGFGERIRELRLQLGLTLADLAEQSGVSKGYLSQLENGKRTTVSIPVGREIARALDVDLNHLFGNGDRHEAAAPESAYRDAADYPDVIKKLVQKRRREERPLTKPELETLLGLQYRGKHPDTPEELELLLNQLKYYTRKSED